MSNLADNIPSGKGESLYTQGCRAGRKFWFAGKGWNDKPWPKPEGFPNWSLDDKNEWLGGFMDALSKSGKRHG